MLQFLTSNKSRAKSRRAAYFHLILNIALPVGVLLLVRANLPYMAVLLVILAKWRVFAVQPRYWPANIRSNSVDTIVGISFVVLIHSTPNLSIQLIFTIVYVLWLNFLKPRSETIWVSAQALFAQTIGLVALQDFMANRNPQSWPELLTLITVFLISVSAARHFLSSYQDRYLSVLSLAWALFITELSWILGHWQLFYERYVSHIAILATVFGYVCMRLYDRTHNEQLSKREIRAMVIFSCVILLVVVALSNWRRSLY